MGQKVSATIVKIVTLHHAHVNTFLLERCVVCVSGCWEEGGEMERGEALLQAVHAKLSEEALCGVIHRSIGSAARILAAESACNVFAPYDRVSTTRYRRAARPLAED